MINESLLLKDNFDEYAFGDDVLRTPQVASCAPRKSNSHLVDFDEQMKIVVNACTPEIRKFQGPIRSVEPVKGSQLYCIRELKEDPSSESVRSFSLKPIDVSCPNDVSFAKADFSSLEIRLSPGHPEVSEIETILLKQLRKSQENDCEDEEPVNVIEETEQISQQRHHPFEMTTNLHKATPVRTNSLESEQTDDCVSLAEICENQSQSYVSQMLFEVATAVDCSEKYTHQLVVRTARKAEWTRATSCFQPRSSIRHHIEYEERLERISSRSTPKESSSNRNSPESLVVYQNTDLKKLMQQAPEKEVCGNQEDKAVDTMTLSEPFRMRSSGDDWFGIGLRPPEEMLFTSPISDDGGQMMSTFEQISKLDNAMVINSNWIQDYDEDCSNCNRQFSPLKSRKYPSNTQHVSSQRHQSLLMSEWKPMPTQHDEPWDMRTHEVHLILKLTIRANQPVEVQVMAGL